VAGNYDLCAQLLQQLDILDPAGALLGGNLAGEGMGLIEQDVAAVQRFDGGDPHDGIPAVVAHNVVDDLDFSPSSSR
jgi:hypothetical protein